MHRADKAAAAAQALFPPGAEVAAVAIGTAPPPWPTEAAAVASAIPARQAEFAAGRAAARAALEALGLPPVALPASRMRAPCWPSGIAGSICHTDGLALAVLAPTRQCLSLGLDAEPDEPFPEDLVDSVTLPAERRWIAAQPDPSRAARLIFVAKEAAYKCQFPASHTLIGFDAIRIDPRPQGRLTATFMRPVAPFNPGDRLSGRHGRGGGLVLAGFTRAVTRTADGPFAP
ncbi:4'-phosphopantetheinyl transferase family protein [Gemmobacter sp.]|uniref:4'-phosphopantetheinyl transferase family protein n=1 Tax=Gemmobacter sp. TaxID=1898957 RepID=UPI002B002273|nr:4'-phosphopantetheinyl transferase superfamily protein [Gemmobacter sp.]